MTIGQANGYIDDQPAGGRGLLTAAWRPAGLAYLAMMLIGLAAGLWPGSVRGAGNAYSPTPILAVQTLVVAQVAFYLLAYPVIVLFRSSPGRTWRWWPDAVVEMLFWTFAGGAFFAPAVWLSGSGVLDAIRGSVYVCGLWPMAWVCGAWLSSENAGRGFVIFISVFAAIGLPWLWYVSVEFFASADWSETLRSLCPAANAWQAAARGSGAAAWDPTWPFLIWPIVAAIMFALWTILPAAKTDAVRD